MLTTGEVGPSRSLLAAALLALGLGAAALFIDQGETVEQVCKTVSGTTVEHTVDGVADAASRVLVHLPACYEISDRDYPVIYLFHGGGGRPDMWVERPVGANDIVDELAAAGTIDQVVLVMPSGASGRPEFAPDEFDIISNEIDQAFRVRDDAGSRAVAGISAGGPSAVVVATESEASRFETVGLLMSVWGENMGDRAQSALAERGDLPAVLIEYGEDDGLARFLPDMLSTFRDAGIEPEHRVLPGGHDGRFVDDRLAVWMQWLALRVS